MQMLTVPKSGWRTEAGYVIVYAAFAVVLTAVEALREEGAIVVGVAVIVERGAAQAVADAGFDYRAAFSLEDLGLG